MANTKRLTVALRRGEAIKVTRVSVGDKKLVYVLLAQKSHKYPHGRSHVVYVGTTKNGVSRVASSVAAKAEAILKTHGVKDFTLAL